jgi:hypothetical protein
MKMPVNDAISVPSEACYAYIVHDDEQIVPHLKTSLQFKDK